LVATMAGERIAVLSASAQGQFAGLDQVNLGPLPRSFAGRRGTVELTLLVDAALANRVTIAPALPATGEWGRRAELLEPNSEIAVAELHGKVYVIGGYPSNRVTVATVQVYDPGADLWTLTTPLPTPLNHAMAAGVNGKLYVIGGQTSSAGAGNFVDLVFEYDPLTAAWTRRAPMPTARGGGAAACLGDRIYVAGARPPRGADFAVYDTRANAWTTLPDLPTQRNHLAAAAIGGKIYVAGGRFEGGFQSPQTDAVEVFDPLTSTWTARARMPLPRGGVNGVEALGCLHVFGGEGNSNAPSGVYPDHDVYNPVTNTWTRLGPLPVPVHGVTGAAFLDGLLYLPGGGVEIGGSSGSRHHQVYRPRLACQ
ncbi:MAG: kelch repeat-containing protein, partial [Acidobacteriota bacterium]